MGARVPADRVKVLAVDDDDLMRAGLQGVLASDASDRGGRRGRRRPRSHLPPPAAQPDLVLMDIRMPDIDGLAATRRAARRARPTVRVVVLTTFEHDEFVFGALRAGA